MTPPDLLHSRDNPLLQKVRRIVSDPGAYRKVGLVWLEGDHLVDAARRRGVSLEVLVLTESAWSQRPDWQGWSPSAKRTVRVTDALMKSLVTLESPPPMGALIQLPEGQGVDPLAASVVLDRLQDAGNVGSILRSAAALGVRQVLALKGTVALWSSKVLRAGMGAHFGLRLCEGLAPADLSALQVPLLATSSHGGACLGDVALPQPCAWVFGHEGRGVDPGLMARCVQTLRIPQPGGEESFNVAAAAAICLFTGVCGLRRSAVVDASVALGGGSVERQGLGPTQ